MKMYIIKLIQYFEDNYENKKYVYKNKIYNDNINMCIYYLDLFYFKLLALYIDKIIEFMLIVNCLKILLQVINFF